MAAAREAPPGGGEPDRNRSEHDDESNEANKTQAQQEDAEEEEYDPPLNPHWHAAFRNRETIFDSRPRYRSPRRPLDEMRAVREAWRSERHMIKATGELLKRKLPGGGLYGDMYRGSGGFGR